MPLTIKQKEYLHNCTHRWNIKTGATGSGKSYLDIGVTIGQRIMHTKGDGLIVLFGNTRGTLERNILEPMRELYPYCIGNIRSDNTIDMFGKRCYALGADNKKHVARIQGATIEYAYGDEVTTWSQDVFQMLKSRLRCKYSFFDGTCNPDSPNHWFKKFLESDADIYEQSYVIDDGVLPEYVVNELKKEYMGTVYYDRYILGKWALAEGLIYPMYQSAVVDSVPDQPITQYALSIDYGTMNAFAAILWCKRGNIWYGEREYYYSGRDTGVQKTDEDYANDLDEWIADVWEDMQERPVMTMFGSMVDSIPTIIDPSAASFITLMKRREWCKVRHADNAVKDGIMETAVALQLGLVKLVKGGVPCLIKELGGYVWDNTEGEEKPVKVADHGCDSMRYFVKTMRVSTKNR